MREVGRRDHALATAGELVGEQLPPLSVELAHHVVEQQQWGAPAAIREHGALGQQQRQQGETQLALRAVAAQLTPIAGEHELVAVRAVGAIAALQLAGEAFAQLRHELLDIGSARARAVAHDGLATQPKLGRPRCERLVQKLHHAFAVFPQGDRVTSQLAIPRG